MCKDFEDTDREGTKMTRTCVNCGNDGPGFICEAGHDTEGGRSKCRDWTPKEEAHYG